MERGVSTTPRLAGLFPFWLRRCARGDLFYRGFTVLASRKSRGAILNPHHSMGMADHSSALG
jgi:hypothetical protein